MREIILIFPVYQGTIGREIYEAWDNIDFTVNFRNCQVTNVVVANHIPQGMQFREATEGGQYKDATRQADTGVEAGKVKIDSIYDAASRMAIFNPIPVMGPGDSATYKVQVKAEEIGDAVNTAVLTFAEFSREITVQEQTKFYK